MKYQKEFTSKDTAFLKLRNTVASQEFTFVQIKRFLQEENMRMVYKVLGLQVPKKVKESLKLKGVEFAEHWPVNRNL